MNQFTVSTIADLAPIVKTLIHSLTHSKIICFYGNLGAGKTTLISALCKALAVTDVISSPTYAIIQEYNSAVGKIYHMDLYRVSDVEELQEIGFDDYIFSNELCLIEWADNYQYLLPTKRIEVFLTCTSNNERIIKITTL